MNFILFLILNQVSVSIPDTLDEKTHNILIPINVSNLTGLEVYSADITVKYRQEVLIADSVSKAGTLAQGWFMDYNTDSLGKVTIAMAGVDAAVGNGAIAKIAFHVPGSAVTGDTGTIYFTKMMLNEGDPACNTYPGLFTVDTGVAIEENIVNRNPKIEAYPNPFAGKTIIKLINSRTPDLKIQIYDISGNIVRNFRVNQCNNQCQSVSWDGKDDDGRLLSNGIYFCKLFSGETPVETTPIIKIMLIR